MTPPPWLGAVVVAGACALAAWLASRPDSAPAVHDACPGCGLRFTTARALGFHLAPDGSCLDPRTARRPRGGFVASIVWTDHDGAPVWGWPRKVLDARSPAERERTGP